MNNLSVKVQNRNGAPVLHINSEPDTGLMLYHNRVEVGCEEIRDFAKAGINLITAPIGGVECLRPNGTLDTHRMDDRIQRILDANPSALVLVRIGLHPPKWWVDGNPDHMLRHFDPYLGHEVDAEWSSPAFSSEKWRNEMGKALQQVIHYLEGVHGGSVLGYHLCAGDCGEWSYAWRNYTQSDYSMVQRDAFRKWLGDDSAEVPRDWRRKPGNSSWLDPEEDVLLMRYLQFHSRTVADAILHFSGLAKAQLRSMALEKIVAVFYGYHFTPPGNPSAFFNSGHHALANVLASPDVDVLCAPYSYFQREAGGTYYSQLVTGSARLHGKLAYTEEDTVTHVVPPIDYRYHCPDLKTTTDVLRRNVLGSLRDGGTSWYMDWFGMNWYRDQALMDSIAETTALARERLDWDNSSVAQIAVLVSESMAFRLWHDPELINHWTLERMSDLWRIGAPVDVFLDTDYEALDKLRYRLIIKPDSGDVRSTADWRRTALDSGVHIYCDNGDQVMAEKGLLTIHACSDGPRTVKLPLRCDVTDAFTNAVIASDAEGFVAVLRLGETAVWKLSPVPAGVEG